VNQPRCNTHSAISRVLKIADKKGEILGENNSGIRLFDIFERNFDLEFGGLTRT